MDRPPRCTPFDDWAKTWLASRHKQAAAKKAANESLLVCHVIGDREHGFGSRPIGSITPLQVQEWVNHMVGGRLPAELHLKRLHPGSRHPAKRGGGPLDTRSPHRRR